MSVKNYYINIKYSANLFLILNFSSLYLDPINIIIPFGLNYFTSNYSVTPIKSTRFLLPVSKFSLDCPISLSFIYAPVCYFWSFFSPLLIS